MVLLFNHAQRLDRNSKSLFCFNMILSFRIIRVCFSIESEVVKIPMIFADKKMLEYLLFTRYRESFEKARKPISQF
jgi:hypothetical protein